MAAAIYAIATMDSKGDEIAYVARCARAAGANVVLVDSGTKDAPTQKPDISREAVASCHPKGKSAVLGQTFPEFLGHGRGATLPHGPGWLTPLSVGLALGGLVLAWLVHQRRAVSAGALTRGLGPLPTWAAQGYGLDALYLALYRGAVLALSRLVGWIDRYVVDGLVNVASAFTLRAGAELRQLQTGRAQDYLYGVTAGLLLVLVFWRLWA